MDRSPGGRVGSPGGGWEVLVREGGELRVRPMVADQPSVHVDDEVDPRVSISADDGLLIYARRGLLGETDLWQVALDGGPPLQLTAWDGSEDRPLLSPDARRLAFVSGRTGIASWWVVSLDGALPIPPEAGLQLSNIGVEQAPRSPGHPPVGFVPVPDGTPMSWIDDRISWEAQGEAHSLVVPP